MRPIPVIAALAALALAAPAAAQNRVENLERDAIERARSDITDLLRTLCPEQCLLLNIDVSVDEERSEKASPGFEAITGDPRVAKLRSISATVVADEQLPNTFRTRLKALVTDRLKAFRVPVRIDLQSVKMPPRNAPHLEIPTPPQPLQAQPVVAAPAPPPQPAPAPVEAAKPPTPAERWMDAAPALAAIALAALALIIVAALLALAIRRASAPPPQDYYLPPEPMPAQPSGMAEGAAPSPGAPGSPEAQKPWDPARRAQLAALVRNERPARNAVVREALEGGEGALVATWSREFGPALLDDVRGDRDLAPALAAVAAELRRAQGSAAGSRALEDLENRLLAARLTLPVEPAEELFAFLDGVPASRGVAAIAALSAEDRALALRFAPKHLRAAALQALPSGERAALALAWAASPTVDAARAEAVAGALRAKVGAIAGAGGDAALLQETIFTLERSEQDALIERLRLEAPDGAAERLIGESSVLVAPADALAAALLATPHPSLLTYLGGADADLRERVQSVLPDRLQREVREEVAYGSRPARAAFIAAREQLLTQLGNELRRRGTRMEELRAAPAATRS